MDSRLLLLAKGFDWKVAEACDLVCWQKTLYVFILEKGGDESQPP